MFDSEVSFRDVVAGTRSASPPLRRLAFAGENDSVGELASGEIDFALELVCGSPSVRRLTSAGTNDSVFKSVAGENDTGTALVTISGAPLVRRSCAGGE